MNQQFYRFSFQCKYNNLTDFINDESYHNFIMNTNWIKNGRHLKVYNDILTFKKIKKIEVKNVGKLPKIDSSLFNVEKIENKYLNVTNEIIFGSINEDNDIYDMHGFYKFLVNFKLSSMHNIQEYDLIDSCIKKSIKRYNDYKENKLTLLYKCKCKKCEYIFKSFNRFFNKYNYLICEYRDDELKYYDNNDNINFDKFIKDIIISDKFNKCSNKKKHIIKEDIKKFNEYIEELLNIYDKHFERLILSLNIKKKYIDELNEVDRINELIFLFVFEEELDDELVNNKYVISAFNSLDYINEYVDGINNFGYVYDKLFNVFYKNCIEKENNLIIEENKKINYNNIKEELIMLTQHPSRIQKHLSFYNNEEEAFANI